MPIYEYRRPDGSTFEVHQPFSEDPLTTDPETGAPVERVLHAPAVHFKGKGFYNTDYGTRKRQRENAASASADTSSSGSSGDSSSSEGSSEAPSKGDSNGKADAKKSESTDKPAEKKAAEAKPVAAAK